MSIQAVAWALEQEDIPARPKLVLVSICNHANHADGYCWLNVETIAHEAACSRRAVFNFVGDLIRNGYLRKAPKRGDDGKQRANDYWVLLHREPMPWHAVRAPDETDDPAPLNEADIEPQDVADGVHGVHAAPTVEIPVAEPVETPAGAPGPHASACTPIESAEPSKINPKSPARDPALTAATRGYRPPPPQPIAADLNLPTKQIFVYAGTPAYAAWATHMANRNRTRAWSLTTRANIDGKWCTGWYFPSLFPPPDKSSTDPPKDNAA